jgi:hypothetical protein
MPRTALCCLAACLQAAEHTGAVKFGGLPVPGVSVHLTQGGRSHHAVTDAQGVYAIREINSGTVVVEVEMNLFARQRRELTSPGHTEWELVLLPREQLATKVVRQAPEKAAFQRTAVSATPIQTPAQPPPADPVATAELARQAADGFLISGSVNNAASSPLAQLQAFGNNRRAQRSLYNGNLGVILNNSLFDARAYSLTGQNTVKPDYSRIQGVFSFGGPIRIPGLVRRGPVFSVNYQWTRHRNATTQTGLMPASGERAGQFASLITDPASGMPLPGNRIPADRISPQARALLQLFPEPNFTDSTRYNFQLPIVSGLHQDDLQTRVNKQVRRNWFSGAYSLQSTRTDTPDLFGFLDTGHVNGWNATAGYRRLIDSRSFVNVSLNFNRLTTRTTPFFAHRENVSGLAGIRGNNQEPINWGPPNLGFSGGLTPLTSPQASLVRNQTGSISTDYFLSRHGHNLSTGYTHRRQQFNILAQQDARGTFTFTGVAAGNDFAGFLLGIPDTSSIAFGNADKYLRGRINEAFVNDDWRVNPGFTINAGVRWEYWSPVHEKYGRLVNLDIGSATPNTTLPRPDRNNIAPRVAFSWRPLAASSLVVRGGFGIYHDTSIYQPIAQEMSQQAPLSKSLRISNSSAAFLTLANGFSATGSASTTTFGVDPEFRTGYVQTWKISVQSDLPAALQFNASYLGSKGTRGQQQFLPNTFPTGPAVPFGFVYLVSNGNASRHAGELQLRRRLRKGLTAQFHYTWAKSIDNALLGGRGRAVIAQNWLDLGAERARSTFDQRHLIATSFQYTTGLGLNGRRARLLKEWTIRSQLSFGGGLPLSPLVPLAIPGTGYTGILRPDYTGISIYDAPAGMHLNPAAVRVSAGWGNAGRNSINGPRQFVINSSLGRTLRTWDRVSLDMRIDATNSTNTPVFPSWNVVAGHAQFGLPNSTNPMRAARVTIRMGF